jgi:hypothetical protein
MNSNYLEAIAPERIEYLLHQQQLYQVAKPKLLEQYEGQTANDLVSNLVTQSID